MTKSYRYIVNVFWSEEDAAYVAEVPELPGCASHGKTPEVAMRNVQNAIETWIEGAKESGFKIPEPVSTKAFSGKFVTRVDPRLHQKLTIRAETSGKSLNGLVKEILEKEIA